MKLTKSQLGKKAGGLARVLLIILAAFLLNAIILVATGKSVGAVYRSQRKGIFSDT